LIQRTESRMFIDTLLQKFKLYQQRLTYNTFEFLWHLYSAIYIYIHTHTHIHIKERESITHSLIFSKLLQKWKHTNATSVTGCV
jgi:predicted membrane protein